MAILVDWMGHMVSTESADELHRFADKLGLRRRWFQTRGREDERHDHYDLTTSNMVSKALHEGAEKVNPKDVIRRAWWGKERRK